MDLPRFWPVTIASCLENRMLLPFSAARVYTIWLEVRIGFPECLKITPDGRARSKEDYERIVAKNTDRSIWSEKNRKKLDELNEKRLLVIMAGQKMKRSAGCAGDPVFIPFHADFT
jgi:hypothetical protein